VTGFNVVLLALTAAGAALGVWAICWARASRHPRRVAWGRLLFVLTQLAFALGGLVAAGHRADALAPLGLCAGLLVVGMVWEVPLGGRAAGEALPREEG
jgi:hypothetical protein